MIRALTLRSAAVLIGAGVFPATGARAEEAVHPRGGDRVDLARFGTPITGEGFAGVEWDNPREVDEVRATLRFAGAPPERGNYRVEWWGSIWPNNGTGGWMRLDDEWNGKWVGTDAAATGSDRDGTAVYVFKFPPLTSGEWKIEDKKNIAKGAVTFRRTLKVRVVAVDGRAGGLHIQAFGGSIWKEGSFDIAVRCDKDGNGAGTVDAINGVRLAKESLPAPQDATVLDVKDTEGPITWAVHGRPGGAAGVRFHLLYAENPDLNSNDLTRVTVRVGDTFDAQGFSFVPQDVLRNGGVMRVPAFNAVVTAVGESALPSAPAAAWPKTVRGRIAGHPEASRESAMAGIPRLAPPRWVPLGVPSARQEPVVGPNGDWSMWLESLWTPGREDARIPRRPGVGKASVRLFRGEKLDALLDTRAEPAFDGKDREEVVRYLEDKELPAIHVEWKTGAIQYHHALATTILLGDYGDDDTRRGDETVVLLTKLEVRNAGTGPETATVNLRWSHPAPLALNEDGLVALAPKDAMLIPAGLTGVRGMISVDKPVAGAAAGFQILKGSDGSSSDILCWSASLKPGETRTIWFKQPYVDLLDAKELERLKAISYEEEVPKVLDYWRKRLAGGMRFDVPEPELRRFYDANLWHICITTDRDPQTGLYNQGVGTFAYRVFANETVMIARSMDMRGEHKEAERFLEPMLRYQGDMALKGRFSTKEGAFHSAGPYTHGEYAMNHGFVLWGIADHYLYTRDRAYLERVAPQLVKGCDFLINERKSTMSPGGASSAPHGWERPSGRDGQSGAEAPSHTAQGPSCPPMHGLAPASSLEDVVEFKYWFSTNGYFYLGMKRVAQALADIKHPEAERIAKEAEAYRQDLSRVVREAVTRAAAVRLRDGTWCPYVPSRVDHWRHLTEGWIREALYPSLQLAAAEVVPPGDPLITWMLDDLEDNIYFSAESGYNVQDVEKNWFERGGVTLQPALVDSPPIYMARNEVPAALRAFWNAYALLIYPDTQCFAEWAKAFGQGGGPVYKTSDEARWVIWARQFLINEEGDTLRLAYGLPRAWLEDGKVVKLERAPTWFGTAGLEIRSEAAKGRIAATVTLPTRNPPREAWLRLRHPQGKRPAKVVVNGRPAPAVEGEDVRLLPGVEDASRPVQVVAEYNR